ncbi:DUF1837 domain-containing protein [bacterium]|nr:DUF1837 domain-containing protein [bacterium]
MINAIPEFALSYCELSKIDPQNVVERIRSAARTIYQTDKFSRRGEFGELLLHLVIRDYYKSIPALSKVYYKDSANNTIKGFDAVHVTVEEDALHLWLGETKFYKDISSAIRDVSSELCDHFNSNFLKNEFLFIQRKLDEQWEHYDTLSSLVDANTSLDKIFTSLKVPVLLTYESPTVDAHNTEDEAYIEAVKKEVEGHKSTFFGKDLPKEIDIILILVPLHKKEQLVNTLHKKLKHMQSI